MHVTDENITDHLMGAHYDYAYEICKIFLSYYYNKADTVDDINIDLLQRVIRSKADLQNIRITFDESIWLPKFPKDHKRLMLFEIQLKRSMEIAAFYLYVDNSPSQHPIMVGFRDSFETSYKNQ